MALTTVVAVSACTIGADLRMIPNQPIVFKVDISDFFFGYYTSLQKLQLRIKRWTSFDQDHTLEILEIVYLMESSR